MPPDVFFVLASSGLTLVASLMFFVSNDAVGEELTDSPGNHVGFCLPPVRPGATPPPLPASRDASVRLSTPSLRGVMTLRPQGLEWEITLDTVPVSDAPAMQVEGRDGRGSVHDLRWNQRAGLPRALRHVWKQKPANA